MRAILTSDPDIELVGEAGSGQEAAELALKLQPDVILMDINMPGTNGIEATRHILEQSPDTGILMLTMFEDDESVFAAMRAGARGYVLKAPTGLRRSGPSARWPVERRSSAPPSRAGSRSTSPGRSPATQTFPELTEHERDILVLISQGYTNTAIADRLYLSPKTVRNYVSTIFTKLQVADRAGAIIRAREAGSAKTTSSSPNLVPSPESDACEPCVATVTGTPPVFSA